LFDGRDGFPSLLDSFLLVSHCLAYSKNLSNRGLNRKGDASFIETTIKSAPLALACSSLIVHAPAALLFRNFQPGWWRARPSFDIALAPSSRSFILGGSGLPFRSNFTLWAIRARLLLAMQVRSSSSSAASNFFGTTLRSWIVWRAVGYLHAKLTNG
jgi:hypothetical protein